MSFRDKLAYSENQASKNLKLYRVKQQEVGFIFDTKPIKTKTFQLIFSGGAGSSEGSRTGGCFGDGEEREGGEEEKEGAGQECLSNGEKTEKDGGSVNWKQRQLLDQREA